MLQSIAIQGAGLPERQQPHRVTAAGPGAKSPRLVPNERCRADEIRHTAQSRYPYLLEPLPQLHDKDGLIDRILAIDGTRLFGHVAARRPVDVPRVGQWPYHKRNEAAIKAPAARVGREL